jgi:hypothetical protein
MFALHLKRRAASPSQARRSCGRLRLETLEDRVVPTTIPNGTLIVPTLPSTQVQPLPTTPRGLIAVDPNTGTQTVLTIGTPPFVNPQEVVESPAVYRSQAPPPRPRSW